MACVGGALQPEMDEKSQTEALVRRNRALLARAVEVRAAAHEAVLTAQYAVQIAELSRLDRERRRRAQTLSGGEPRSPGSTA